MNALEIRNLTKHYEGFSLGPVNLTLPSGCIMGFIGENGAGKSTTIKLILDLIKRDGGEVTILGKTLGTESSELKEQIGVVMDECSFPENLTGRDIDAVLKSCYHTWDSARFNQYCRKFSLPEKRRCGEYSPRHENEACHCRCAVAWQPYSASRRGRQAGSTRSSGTKYSTFSGVYPGRTQQYFPLLAHHQRP